MGEIHLFTKEQDDIVAALVSSEYIRNQFYFTGGTALSSLYLHHRHSDDLDFFTENNFSQQILFTVVSQITQKLKCTFTSRFIEVVYIFDILFPDKTSLKVDFSYYPYHHLKPPQKYKELQVDSEDDIAVNKLVTISQRTDVKDFVDLFFLLKKYSLWDLIEGVRQKFKMEVEPLLLAQDFLKVEEFGFLPRMIAPLKLEELQDYFRTEAQKLAKRRVV